MEKHQARVTSLANYAFWIKKQQRSLEGTGSNIRAQSELFEAAHGQFGRRIGKLSGDEIEQRIGFGREERGSFFTGVSPLFEQAPPRVVTQDRQCQQSWIYQATSPPRTLHSRCESESRALRQRIEACAPTV